MKSLDSYVEDIQKTIESTKLTIKTEEIGFVNELKDGVALLTGLDSVAYGELVEFESGVKGYVIDLTPNDVGVIILGDYLKLRSGEQARALGYTLSVPVSNTIIGRVVDSLGVPQDGKSRIKTDTYYPIEKIAPGVVRRRPVNTSLLTGIKAIDSLIPIGRGQRELIIGDRGTGKTTLVVDTILNQKDQDVICIYCAVGQKNAKTATLVNLLKNKGAFEYTIIVNASASESAAMQYLAPYTACAIGEYFMDKGKDVLVIYDDLSKHAWAYRQLSLIMRRPAGREAYPGDVFYLHSRLLERACRLDEKYGGGSLTALPIIETLEGDLSAYIPTNVISITDGQIFLEIDLFNAGIRPAINVGLSVSRVGGNAQSKAMKQIAGKLKLDLAQYRALAAFSQFESDLDEETKKFLNRGAKITQILKQKKNRPYSLGEEVAIIWAATNGNLDSLSQNQIELFETRLLELLNTKEKQWVAKINKQKALPTDDEEALKKIVKLVLDYQLTGAQ